MVLIENRKIKFAVVGCGHIGRRHATMISRNSETELIGVCDIRPLEELGIEALDTKYFSSFEKLLEQEFDVLSICTPNGLHAAQAIQALKKSKHVLVEKPMALTKSDAEKIIFKSLHHSKHVFAVMQNRYSPPSVWIKEVMEKRLLGDIHMVQLNCYWNRDDRYYYKDGVHHAWHGKAELDGGTLFTQFSHFIDLLYWLFGDITNIKANFNDFMHQDSTDFEDSGNVIFDFVNGGMGVLNYSTAVWDSNLESSMTVIGTNGSVKIGGQYMNEVEYCHIKDYEMPKLAASNPANDYGAYKGSANNHPYVFENVIDVLKGRKPMTTNALEGMKIVDIIERIYEIKK